MHRWLMADLVVCLAGWASPSPAAEPVAVSVPRIPVAVAGRSSPAPLVTLGRPRALPGRLPGSLVATELPGSTRPLSLRGTSASPYAPVAYTEPADEPEEDPSTSFAVERVSYTTPVVKGTGTSGPPAVPAPVYSGPVPPPEFGIPVEDGFFIPDGGEPTAFMRRAYASAEYLLWSTKNAGIPPLVTTSTNPGDLNTIGALGDPTTRVLFGSRLDHGTQSGARFQAGYWFGDCKPFAIEGGFFFLSPRSARFAADSSQFPLLARPFQSLNPIGVAMPPFETSEIVAKPGIGTGGIRLAAPSSLYGTNINLRCPLLCCDTCNGGWATDFLVGTRFLNLREGLYITEFGQTFPNMMPAAGVVPNLAFRIDDRFDTQNHFYGGLFGLDHQIRRGRWSFGARGTLAMGVTHQVLNVNGGATFVNLNSGVTTQMAGGLLALPGTNIGRFTQDRFAVVPQIGLNVGYYITDGLRIFGGYNFLYWSSVLRPGDQIDRSLDTRLVPTFGVGGPPLRPGPVPLLKEKDFWAQGFSGGVELRW
jgi:Putative beta barrel porin-7 (BBP7)